MGDGLVRFVGYGYEAISTQYIECGEIAVEVDDTPSIGSVPGRIVFKTRGGAGLTERMRLDDTGRVRIGGSGAVTSSALLELDSNVAGFLPPRGTNADITSIPSPAAGLIMYDTTNNQWLGYNGTSWVVLG